MIVNRGRIEITAHILGLRMKPQVKTRIMYNANITFRQFEIYAALLKSQDLLAMKRTDMKRLKEDSNSSTPSPSFKMQ